jgi:hypothetical protein
MLAEHELADLFLAERLTAPDLRARLVAGMPRGYRVVELHNEWVGAPPLAPQLVAADYRMTLLGVERAVVEEGSRALLAAERLPREKRRENRTVAYDLRPLLMELRVGEVQAVIGAAPAAPAVQAAAASPAVGLWVRLRHSQDEGSGRAEEVVAALADVLPGSSSARAAADRPAIEIVHPIRERLWLADELAG